MSVSSPRRQVERSLRAGVEAHRRACSGVGTFAIGTTTVTCEASDAAANPASARGFDVHVKGADEQLDDLIGAGR